MKKYRVVVHGHYAGFGLQQVRIVVKETTTIQNIINYAEKKLEGEPQRVTIAMVEKIKDE